MIIVMTIPPHVETPVRPLDPARESSSSLSSSVVDVKDNRKRDLSPPSKSKHNAPMKKNRSTLQKDVWNTWNKNGVRVATSWGVDTLRTILHGKSKPDLNELSAQVSLAADNFKSLFPVDDEPEDVIRYQNEEPHTEFLSLQTELKIPSIAEA